MDFITLFLTGVFFAGVIRFIWEEIDRRNGNNNHFHFI